MRKKSFYKKQLRRFIKSHRVALATIAGAAGAIVVSAILGTEKAKQAISSLETGVKDLTNKAARGLKKESTLSQV